MDGILITYFWDLIKNNSEQLIAEFKSLTKGNEIKGQIYENTVLLNKDNIYIGKNTKIKPGVVIDAEDGPVYISDDVLVEPNAVIQGPAFIGNRTIVRLGAKIRLNTSIGEVCRVGGEIEDTIIHSYSNKQHDGFLGHAYVGMWCNFGAGTTNSDLKNNYSNIKVFVEGKLMDSGSMFIGLIMSDHSKAAISTVFNSGTVVGVSSNIFGEGFPPKFIPSFSWGAIKSKHIYRPEDAIETAQKVMARRKKQLSKAEAGLLKHIFESTKKERKIMLYV
jgi:UDP-N-acetylglucosamine diphosphorylase/glucosamine-1-phosphate N-acetyltransferase